MDYYIECCTNSLSYGPLMLLDRVISGHSIGDGVVVCEPCDSPPLNNCRVRVVFELRSSMLEAELLPTVSVRRFVDGVWGEEYFGSISSCHCSLSSSMLNSKVLFNSDKSFSRPPSIKGSSRTWSTSTMAEFDGGDGAEGAWEESIHST